MRVRDAAASDVAFVAALAREAFARFGEYDSFIGEMLGDGAVARIAEEDGRPVGFALLLRLEPVDSFDLVALAVAPDARRRGTGRALLEEAHACALAAAGISAGAQVLLHVAEVNVPARSLFESAGYRFVARDDGTYPNGQRALTMERRLVRGKPVA